MARDIDARRLLMQGYNKPEKVRLLVFRKEIKGMPSTHLKAGVKLLIENKDKLQDNEVWFKLIEHRQAILKPHLDDFTFQELGKVECLSRETFKHEVSIDGPEVVGTGDYSLKTQGIFCLQPWQEIEREKREVSSYHRLPADGKLLIWGLTRSNQWVIATVHFVGEWGYKDRGYERATKVEIEEVSIPELVIRTKEKPRKIWAELGNAICKFHERRRALYLSAKHLALAIEVEQEILTTFE
jgi:hypothetical protein